MEQKSTMELRIKNLNHSKSKVSPSTWMFEWEHLLQEDKGSSLLSKHKFHQEGFTLKFNSSYLAEGNHER